MASVPKAEDVEKNILDNFKLAVKRGLTMPNFPKEKLRPLWGVKFTPDAIHRRISDFGDELMIASDRLDERTFSDGLARFESVIDSELVRGVEDEWPELDVEERGIIAAEIPRAADYLDAARKRLERLRGQIDQRIIRLAGVKLPTVPRSAGEVVADAVERAVDAGGRVIRGVGALLS